MFAHSVWKDLATFTDLHINSFKSENFKKD